MAPHDEGFESHELQGRRSAELIKQVNALAEEAGRIVAAEGLALGPAEVVLAQARARDIRPEALKRLEEVFAEIAALKGVLAARRRV